MTFAADFLGDFFGESLEIFSHFLFNIRLLCLASLQNCSLSLEIMRIPNSHKDSNGLRVEINLFFFLSLDVNQLIDLKGLHCSRCDSAG